MRNVGARGIQDSVVAAGAGSREGSRDSVGTKFEPPGDTPGERRLATKDLGTKDEQFVARSQNSRDR